MTPEELKSRLDDQEKEIARLRKEKEAEEAKLRNENVELQQRLSAAESAAKAGKKSPVAVVGTYTAKNKKKYQFKPGFHFFRLPRISQLIKDKEVLKALVDPMQRVYSEKALKNATIMEALIKMKFYGIEVVK